MRTARTAALISLVGLALVMGLSIALEPRPLPAPPPDEEPAQDVVPAPDPSAAQVLPALAEEKLVSADATARAEAVAELVERIESEWPDDHRRDFLVRITPLALQAAVDHCVPPSVTLGQAILESGWGRSDLAREHGNLFGVKGQGVSLPTREVEDGQDHTRTQGFATYEDWRASVAHHQELLAGDPRYAEARSRWAHWPEFLAALGPVYATDPAYVRQVGALVRDYQLDRWDALVRRAARKHADCDDL